MPDPISVAFWAATALFIGAAVAYFANDAVGLVAEGRAFNTGFGPVTHPLGRGIIALIEAAGAGYFIWLTFAVATTSSEQPSFFNVAMFWLAFIFEIAACLRAAFRLVSRIGTR